MVQQWKWLLLWGHFMQGSSRAVCQGLARSRSPGEMQRQLWPPNRPGPANGGSSAWQMPQRTRLSQSTFSSFAMQGDGFGAMQQQVVYQDLLALLSVAYGNQRGVIEEQRSRMDRLLAEFRDLRQELEEDPELQLLYTEVRRQRKAKEKKKKSKKKSKKEKAKSAEKQRPDL
mmetsp:Transcript_28208/g.45352  ORF Transcript_28208/g.45352 Transcript_28208/m.45352 type:complete len:172 (+) Transcript_28208:66-581(+)